MGNKRTSSKTPSCVNDSAPRISLKASPYGNPIPGLDELGSTSPTAAPETDLQRVDEIARHGGGRALICRISEHVQLDPALMSELKKVGVMPGKEIDIVSVVGMNKPIEVRSGEAGTKMPPSIAHAVLVRSR